MHRWMDRCCLVSYVQPQELLIYYGDRWNVGGPGSVGNATYVWLPLVPDPMADLGLQLLDPGQSWRLGDYKPQKPTVVR
jgi:hypothetical protein